MTTDKPYRYFRSPAGFKFRCTGDARDDQQLVDGIWTPTATKWRLETYLAAIPHGMTEITESECI